MPADVLATVGARVSPGMVLTNKSEYSVSIASEKLKIKILNMTPKQRNREILYNFFIIHHR